MGLFSFQQDLAIDLGTANTRIIYKDKIVVNEPSVVAFNTMTGKMIAIGEKASQMYGKINENIRTIRPRKEAWLSILAMESLKLLLLLLEELSVTNLSGLQVMILHLISRLI